MADKVIIRNNRVGLGTLLFILFLGLKLTGHIDWSWWWVTAPLWIPLAILLTVLGVMFVLFVIAEVLK